MLEHALAYARTGNHVFPLSPGTKIPFANSRGHLDATTDETQIRAWWGKNPDANIGISLEPSGLVVLDVDVGAGKRGFEALQQIYEIELPPATLTAHTMGGGLHFVFTRPEGVPAQRKIDFQHAIQPEYGKGSGLDLLGKGFIVVAPSLSRKTGRRYQWANTVQPVPLPAFIAKTYFVSAAATAKKRDLAKSDVIEGGRNTAIFRLGCSIRDLGLSEDSLHHSLSLENAARCNPPLDDLEIAGIVAKVMSRVVPSRDVLDGSVFLDTLFPQQEVINSVLVKDQGRISVTTDQLAEYIPPIITMRPTGIEALDKMGGGGFVERDLTVLIGPPGTGKTSFALKLCATPPPSLYVSSELQTSEIKARLAAERLGVPWLAIMTGLVPAEDIRNSLSGLNMRIIGSDDLEIGRNGTPLITPRDKIRAIAEEAIEILAETGRTPLIVVDYVQDMARKCTEARDPVGDISLLLRNLAKGLGAPVLAVSSTSRTWYGQHPEIVDAVGFLGAGKESGAIEYDAATVWYLDVLREMSLDYQIARMAVCKSRHARTGFIGMHYHGAKGGQWLESDTALDKFEELAESKSKKVAAHFDPKQDDAAVIKYLSEKGSDPISVIKFNLGIPTQRAKTAIDRLLQQNKVKVINEMRLQPDQRMTSVQVLSKIV